MSWVFLPPPPTNHRFQVGVRSRKRTCESHSRYLTGLRNHVGSLRIAGLTVTVRWLARRSHCRAGSAVSRAPPVGQGHSLEQGDSKSPRPSQDSLSHSSPSYKQPRFPLLAQMPEGTGGYSLSKRQCALIPLIVLSLGGQLISNLQKKQLTTSVSPPISDNGRPG